MQNNRKNKADSPQSEYLKRCLKSYYMAHRAKHRELYREKRDAIKRALETHFGDKLAGKIIMSGSLAKSTELNTKFDLDMIVPFKHNTFSLETMASVVYQFLQRKFTSWGNYEVRNQRVSVGVKYAPWFGASVSIDVVPGREIGLNAYKADKYLKLYDSNGNTHFQTNIAKQVEALKDAPNGAKRIIRLLKIWKCHGGGPKIKSFILELIVIEAFRQSNTWASNDLSEQLKYVLRFIADNIQSVKLIDPGNSSNNVANLITDQGKADISKSIKQMLKSIKDAPKLIERYFPPNRAFYRK